MAVQIQALHLSIADVVEKALLVTQSPQGQTLVWHLRISRQVTIPGPATNLTAKKRMRRRPILLIGSREKCMKLRRRNGKETRKRKRNEPGRVKVEYRLVMLHVTS